MAVTVPCYTDKVTETRKKPWLISMGWFSCFFCNLYSIPLSYNTFVFVIIYYCPELFLEELLTVQNIQDIFTFQLSVLQNTSLCFKALFFSSSPQIDHLNISFHNIKFIYEYFSKQKRNTFKINQTVIVTQSLSTIVKCSAINRQKSNLILNACAQ